ncbi:uncharacterized protein LOC133902371 [Phragmites australis]|uniref:uncharacterized protein LOC133902371 n=1 Tax=Phragmites australis TaxID=29695 RepID=UPI002D7884C6|nr:uncharacterized protein LOC133902371 [Phragmites australis]
MDPASAIGRTIDSTDREERQKGANAPAKSQVPRTRVLYDAGPCEACRPKSTNRGLHIERHELGRLPPCAPTRAGHRLAAGFGDVVLCVGRTDVDAPARDMLVVSRNANLRGLVDVEERCSYAPHPERPDEWTLFRQETSIRCAPLAAVAARVAELVERRCAERFAQNAANGREVVERICDDLAEQNSVRRPR